jgi:hypothetical protein
VELTDGDLIARVLVDDDQHAFGELVRRHQSSVRGLLRQLTRTDVALADDLAQNVSRPGFIALLTIASGKTHGDARNLSESMRNNFKPSGIPRWPILV